MPEEADPADDAAAVDVAAGVDVDVTAAGADEDPPVDELDEPELPQPAIAMQTRMSAPLAYRWIDPEVLVFICGFLFSRCRDRPIKAVMWGDPEANGRRFDSPWRRTPVGCDPSHDAPHAPTRPLIVIGHRC